MSRLLRCFRYTAGSCCIVPCESEPGIGIRWETELRDRHLDVAESQSICHCDGAPGSRGKANQHGLGCGRGVKGKLRTCGGVICADDVQSHSRINLAMAFAGVLQDFGIMHKILGVTCDNPSPNNVMIDELETIIEEFGGDADRIRCFLHIVNLVARSMLKQFDIPKKDGGSDNENNAQLDDRLRDLAEGIELEDEITLVEDEGEEDVGMEELADELSRLSSGEQTAAEMEIHPIRFVLVKVSANSPLPLTSLSLISPDLQARVQDYPLNDNHPSNLASDSQRTQARLMHHATRRDNSLELNV